MMDTGSLSKAPIAPPTVPQAANCMAFLNPAMIFLFNAIPHSYLIELFTQLGQIFK
jgi:hypothetical protein